MVIGIVPRQVEYALLALGDMHAANPGRLFSVRALCKRHRVPFDVMSKAMQRLARAGILRSTKGVRGGYQVIRDLSGVSFLDVMDAVLGELAVVNCLRTGKACPQQASCRLPGSMRVLETRLRELYGSMSVLDLVGTAEQSPTARRPAKGVSMPGNSRCHSGAGKQPSPRSSQVAPHTHRQ
jgi:Rrf2 family protein